MDNAWDSMSQDELLAELDIVERAIGRTSTFDRRTDEVAGPGYASVGNCWRWRSADT
jgi:hypothetical protein